MNSQGPIRSDCQTAREMLVERIGPSGSLLEAPQTFHCSACQDWFKRTLAHARAMNLLPRQVAEFSALDGRVVAGLNAGYRQERAAAVLGSLERLEVPAELEARVGEQLGRMVRGAPAELDQRVARELNAGAGLRAERQVSALARLTAPAELEARVVRELLRLSHPDRLPTRRWVAIAAALFVVVGAASLARLAGLIGGKQPYEFRVVHTDSLGNLDSATLSMLSGVSGVVIKGKQR